ncbi:MAG TPA: pitrilysin family protein [Myxococcota bacterium]|nr:pitrilysin family protein [Myxococcota bacterium]
MKRFLLSLGVFGLLLVPTAEAGKKQPAPAPVVEAAPPPPPVDPEAWRATPPVAGPERPWSAPVPDVVQLSNGVPVYFLRNDALPLVTVRLHMDLGRENNPAGKAGLGALVANLLDEGTKNRDASGIASAALGLGAELSVTAGAEGIDLSLNALTGEALGPSLDLLAEVALSPAFRGADFKRVQAEVLADLAANRSNPRAVASEVMLQQVFGPDHPYGYPVGGTTASVSALKLGDVKKYYKDWWQAGSAALVVVGAVDETAIVRELEARFGGWKRKAVTEPALMAPATLLKTRVVFVESPGSVQSMLLVATPGVARNAPDWHAANVAGTWVAGMFSSPMNMVLREEKGWSYGAYGGFTEARDYGLFAVRSSVQADKTAPAVTEVLRVLGDAAAKPPSEEMLNLSKDNLRKSLAGSFDTNANTAASLAAIPTYTLNAAAWRDFDREVEVINAGRVASMAGRWFRPERQLVVVVGPRTVKGTDASGAQIDVDVVKELQALGYEFVEVKPE